MTADQLRALTESAAQVTMYKVHPDDARLLRDWQRDELQGKIFEDDTVPQMFGDLSPFERSQSAGRINVQDIAALEPHERGLINEQGIEIDREASILSSVSDTTKRITREAFDKLPPMDKHEIALSGKYVITA